MNKHGINRLKLIVCNLGYNYLLFIILFYRSKEFTRFAVSFKELEFSSILRKELIGLTDFIGKKNGAF